MKNFEYAKEQKLIREIWKIHDEIFSTPAKKFIMHFKNTSGYPMRGYDELKENNKQHFNLEVVYNNSIPNLKFGDILITVQIQKLEKCNTTVEYEKDKTNFVITITTDFLHYRQCILTLGDCIECYHYKKHNVSPKITQLISFEKILLDKLKEKNHERN